MRIYIFTLVFDCGKAAVFTATVQAAAFFESDVYKLVDIGLSYLPEKCGGRNAVNVVLDCFKRGFPKSPLP